VQGTADVTMELACQSTVQCIL